MSLHNAFTTTPDVILSVDQNGALVIQNLAYNLYSGTSNLSILIGLSEVAEQLGEPIDRDRDDSGINKDIAAILFSPDGQGQYSYPLDVFVSNETQITSESDLQQSF